MPVDPTKSLSKRIVKSLTKDLDDRKGFHRYELPKDIIKKWNIEWEELVTKELIKDIPKDKPKDIWTEVDEFLEEFVDYKMSLGLEYSCIIDWVADFVPRRNHPLSRNYGGPFRAGGPSRETALRNGMEHTRAMISKPAENKKDE